MSRNSTLQIHKRKKPEEIVKILAEKHDLSERAIQKIISGENTNEVVFAEYMTYTEGHNNLIQYIKELVPFD